jgi:hypothetical protein
MKLFTTLTAIAVLIFAGTAYAQMAKKISVFPDAPENTTDVNDTEQAPVYTPPADSELPKVKYLKMQPVRNLQEKIDRLLQGIKIDIPPEYDYYGYEIRRYMTHVGNIEVYKNPDRRKLEEENIKNAQIVFSYWVADIRKQEQEIQEEIEKTNASSNLRTSYNYNSGVVAAFQVECQGWLTNNEQMLKFLDDNSGAFLFESPFLKFTQSEARDAFAVLFSAREKARQQLNKYGPFAGVIY